MPQRNVILSEEKDLYFVLPLFVLHQAFRANPPLPYPPHPSTLNKMPTPAQLDSLRQAAASAARNAYAPYSHFYVGAAILLDSGEIVTGCNVENASYRLTTCAEQTAIAAAVAAHGPAIRIQAVAVHNLNDTACQPCGACRQTIAEFAPPTALIFYPAAPSQPATCTLADLLPAAFHLTPEP